MNGSADGKFDTHFTHHTMPDLILYNCGLQYCVCSYGWSRFLLPSPVGVDPEEIRGMQGEEGIKGVKETLGPQGLKGDNGTIGDMGFQGQKGIQGRL